MQVRRIRHQRAALQDELQIVPRALRVLEPGRPQRRKSRQAHAAARPERAGGEKLAEGPMHGGRDRPVAGLELPGRARGRELDADAPGQAPERERLRRQRVGLEFVQDLEAMLDCSEMDVGSGQQPTEVGRQISTLGEPENRFQRVRLTQPRIVAPVKELERLDDELDLANPAPPELDVGRLVAPGPDDAVHLRLHRPDGRDDPRVDAETVDGVSSQVLEMGADAGVAGRDARLDEGLSLPQLGALPVVLAVPVERQDDRAHPPFGPEP